VGADAPVSNAAWALLQIRDGRRPCWIHRRPDQLTARAIRQFALPRIERGGIFDHEPLATRLLLPVMLALQRHLPVFETGIFAIGPGPRRVRIGRRSPRGDGGGGLGRPPANGNADHELIVSPGRPLPAVDLVPVTGKLRVSLSNSGAAPKFPVTAAGLEHAGQSSFL